MLDPYAAPREPPSPRDTADLYVDTIAPPVVKAAAGVVLSMGALMLLFAVRLAISLQQNGAAQVLEAGHAGVGLACIAAALGVLRGHVWTVALGVGLALIVGAASLFALATMSLGGLVGGALAVTACVLLALSFGHVARVGRARRAMAAALRREREPAVEIEPPRR